MWPRVGHRLDQIMSPNVSPRIKRRIGESLPCRTGLSHISHSIAHNCSVCVCYNYKAQDKQASTHSILVECFIICSDLDSKSGRTVASSGSQSLSRRKPSSSSQPQSGSTRIVYRESRNPSESEVPFWQHNWFIALLFLMAIGFFGLALFLFLTLDSDISPSSTASASAASSEGVEVRDLTV